MMTRDSADLWFEPTTPLGVAAEDAGALGIVCGPVEVDAKKKPDIECMDQIYIYIWPTPAP